MNESGSENVQELSESLGELSSRRDFLKRAGSVAVAAGISGAVNTGSEAKASDGPNSSENWKTPEIREIEDRLDVELTRIKDDFEIIKSLIPEITDSQIEQFSVDWSAEAAKALEELYKGLPDSFRARDPKGARRRLALINYKASVTFTNLDYSDAQITLQNDIFGANPELELDPLIKLTILAHESIHYERYRIGPMFDRLVNEIYSYTPEQMNEHLIDVLSNIPEEDTALDPALTAFMTYGILTEGPDGVLGPRKDSRELEASLGQAYILEGRAFEWELAPYLGENTQRFYSYFRDGIFQGWEYPREAEQV